VSVDGHSNDDASWGKHLTQASELSGNPISRDIWERVEMDDGVRILRIQYLRYINRSFNMP
jgi:hypothetical protein